MNRFTVTLSEERYRALKEAAAQRGATLGQLIDESLEFYGIRPRDAVIDLVKQARSHAKLGDDEAMALAMHEVKAYRRGA